MLHIKYFLTDIAQQSYVPQRKCDPLTALAIGTSIANGIGSVFGTESSNDTNVMLAREAREWQTEENQKARDFQESMWNKQNEYNTPANQRRLAEDAGYNPYLLGNTNLQSGASAVGTPPMSSAPPTPSVMPINPVKPMVDSMTQILPVIQQGQQVESNVELQHAKQLESMTDSMIKVYKDLGQKGLNQWFDKFAPALQGLNFQDSPYQQMFEEQIKKIRSERYNVDMDSLLKDFQYESNRTWTNQERQASFNNLNQQTKNLVQQLELMAIQGKLDEQKIRESVSQIAKNFADAFQAKKVGDYYEVNSEQISIINKMLDMDLKDKESDFAFNTLVRKYKKEIPNRGVALGLFESGINAQSLSSSMAGNKFIQYGNVASSMLGNMFKVNFGASVNRTNFRNLNPEKPQTMFYSGDGYYMNNGVLQKGNW